MNNQEDNPEWGDSSEHIAIVGMAGRFPGANNVDKFWENLRDGIESITFFTPEDLATSNIDSSLLNDPRFVRADGVIDDMDLFDAMFFGFTPREAELLDPQHRLFLECAWEALESAGYDSESYDGRVGVYASANLSSYLIRNIAMNPALRESATSFQTMLGNDKDFIATRISYKFNLTGPSINVATLCSSSFVAIHLACHSLLNYQCDLALAGAVSLQVSRNEAFFYQEGGIGDPDGHCRAFDAGANGTVSGSGLGIVVLKRLENALADGDTIHAVIRGSAVNNDGALKISYTAPSVEGQAEVIAEALDMAEVGAETITYVETHGTGTRLGDPIEIEALTKAFRAHTQKKGYCAIGSVKTNIGHLVNAGGVASLIKTVLAMKHGQIPASLNFEEPNPRIDFANSPFFVNTRLIEWKTDGFPRRAGVSSFGIGGTNVHIVVEEAPELDPSGEARPWQLLVLSAKTSTALDTATVNLVDHLRKSLDANLADVAYTLQVGRRAFSHRRVLLCRDRQEAISALSAMDPERVWTQFQESRDRPVAFMFAGLGQQLVNVGRDLYRDEPIFCEQVDLCANILEPSLGLDLRDLLYPDQGRAGEAARQLERPALARSALFVLEYALARLWLAWGVRPQALIGDGSGEYAAACLAGVFSLQDALALVAAPQPDLAVRIGLVQPQIPYVSRITGTWLTADEARNPEYWHMRPEATRPLGESLKQLLAEPEQVLLEVGPGEMLSSLALKHPDRAERQVVLASLGPESGSPEEATSLLRALGWLWLAGVRVDWNRFHAHERRHRLPLPTYPFERQRYWIEPMALGEGPARPGRAVESSAIKKAELADWFYIPSWRRSLSPALPAGIPDRTCWLLFVDDCGLGTRLAERLANQNQRVITVQVGSHFARLDDGLFSLNPGQSAEYDALLTALEALGAHPQKVVHLWTVTGDGSGGMAPSEREARAQERGFYSLLFLSQALGRSSSTGRLQITVVSNNSQEVAASDVLYPEKATVLGPAKVIPQEYPNITCRSVDLVLPGWGTRQEGKVLDSLWAELVGDSTDAAVAYRGHQRWVQTFEPVRLDQSEQVSSRLKEGGVYLLVGGLEGAGAVLAEHLAQAFKAKLILTQNLAFPAAEQWTSWLNTHAPDDPTSRQIRKLQDWEERDARVLVLGADATDLGQMQAAVARAEAHFGRLNGAIYATSGLSQADLGSIQEADKAQCELQLQQTIRGARVLSRALADRDLDFCLLISSLSSVLGGLGLVAHSATNGFLDAFAEQNNQAGSFPWISVAWDNWQLGPEHGMGMPLSAQLARLAITPAEGIETFERILACGVGGQIVVSTVDLGARIAQWITRDGAQTGDGSTPGSQITLHARPNLSTPYVAPRNQVEQALVDIWQQTVGIDRIGVYDDFFDLGGDSLLAVQIISRVREMFEMDLPLTNLFEQPTVAFLADYLETIRWAAQGSRAVPGAPEGGREEIEL